MGKKRSYARINPFAARDNRCNFVKVPAEVEQLRILMLGDWHAGHFCHSEELLDYYLSFLDQDPYMRVVLLGDLFESKFKGSPGKPEEQVLSIREQRKYIVGKLEPYADRIDGAVPGNHDERQSNEGGDSLMEVVMDAIGCPHFFEPVGLIGYSSEKSKACSYVIGLRHGSAGGTQIGNGLNAAFKTDVPNLDADIYIEGHCHKGSRGPKLGRLTLDFANRCNTMRTYYVITNGSLLDPRKSYGAMKGYPMCMPEQGILTLDMRKRHKRVSVDF